MFLKTSRLILRDLQMSDFDALYEILSNPDTMQYYRAPFDAEKVQNWIIRNRQRYEILGFGLLAVCLKDSGRLIGDCGVTMQNIHGTICPEIGYHIHPDFQRQKYASEAARAVCDWTFAHTPFGSLYSYMHGDNLASARTAIAYGASFLEEYTDEWGRPVKVYAISRETWKQLCKEREWK